MNKQIILSDTDEEHVIDNFMKNVIDKYKLNEKISEIKYRAVCNGIEISSNIDKINISNNQIIEIITNNRLIAMIYLRRTELNFTEANLIEI